VLDELRTQLGDEPFNARIANGAAMEFDDAMELVRHELATARERAAVAPS
jgi:hypothetical protein